MTKTGAGPSRHAARRHAKASIIRSYRFTASNRPTLPMIGVTSSSASSRRTLAPPGRGPNRSVSTPFDTTRSRHASATPVAASCCASASDTATTTSVRRAASLSRSEEHTSELQSRSDLVCRLLLEKKKKIAIIYVLSRHNIAILHIGLSSNLLAVFVVPYVFVILLILYPHIARSLYVHGLSLSIL